MTLRNGKPLKWMPQGVTDTLDATFTPSGAMASLQNLIRDPSSNGLFICRPASAQETVFATFNTPDFISWFHVVANQVYGLIKSARFPGFDEPFCYDLQAHAFVAITGVTGANIPASPAASGAWVPPTSDVIGVKLIVTHPGFPGGAGNYFGWFDISVPTAPVWAAGNTATNPLPFAPVAVAQFANRAYFASGRFLVYSDVLVPLTVTNATQALTLGDSQSITALGGLPANNLTGAILQALIVFKSQSSPMQMYQITGDAALGTLSINDFKTSTGTLAPMSIVGTPKGLAFMAPDGLRLVDFSMQISDPINTNGVGVAIPFIYAVEPSRIASACNGNVMRCATQNGSAPGAPYQEFWFDFKEQKWTGPHTFPGSLARPYKDKFIIAPQSKVASLFSSDVQQKATSTFIENGAQMSWLYQTPMLPNTEAMAENAMVETTIDIGYPANTLNLLVLAGDQNNTLYDSVSLAPTGVPTLWGAFTWGQALWAGAANALAPRQVPWHHPIVFQRLFIAVNGQSSAATRIGTTRMRYQQLGYLQQSLP